jgi:drug/metabolite transporter (DMT)-like permease
MRLSTPHRRWIYWSGAALATTGVLWLLFHYFVRTHGQFGETAHPLEIWWLRLHGACAMLVLVVIGSLLPVHVRRGWHLRKNLLAGCAMGTLALLLIASGYALYYYGGEEVRPWISAFHWVLGLGAPLVLTWHVWRGRRTHATHREQNRTPAAASAQHSPEPSGTKRVDPDLRAQVSRPSISA